MNKQILIMVCFSLITFGLKAQDHNHGKMNRDDHKVAATYSEVPQHFQSQLAAVFTANLSLNDGFVSSEVTSVKNAVAPVKEALNKVDMGLLKGDAHLAWMSHLKVLKSSLEEITSAHSIEDQRKYFAEFNQALYQSVKAFGILEQEAYYQYCPMASGGKGAYWLSNSDQIRNPYFGEGMLTCGSTKERLN